MADTQFFQEWCLAELHGNSGWTAISDGVPLYHLWFLVDLLVFTAIIGAISPLASSLKRWGEQLWGAVGHIHWFILIVVLTMLGKSLMLSTRTIGIAYVEWWGLSSLYRLASNFPFFAAGLVMYWHVPLREKFLQVPVVTGLLALFASWALAQQTPSDSVLVSELIVLLRYFLVWISVGGMIHGFERCFNTLSGWAQELSDAAYTVFLFHHVLVVLMGYAMLSVDLPIGVKLAVVCGMSLLISLLIHKHIIRRVNWAAWLFNGRGLKRTASAPSAAQVSP